MTRRIEYRKGRIAEDPRGLDVTWTVKARTYLARVEDAYYRESPPAVMLRTRYFNGEAGPEVCAGSVSVLERET